jgi:hypothetical protein
MTSQRFTAKTTQAGWADLLLDGKKIGAVMSMGYTYGHWTIVSFYDKDLKIKLSAIDSHYYSHNTRKQLVERLNNVLEQVA